MPVRLLRPYLSQAGNTLFWGSEDLQDTLRATGNADDAIEKASDYAPQTRIVTGAAANTSRNATIYKMNSATAQTLTLQPSGYWPVGGIVTVTALGTGAVTVTPASGVTINGGAASVTVAAQNSEGRLLKTGPETWTTLDGFTVNLAASVASPAAQYGNPAVILGDSHGAFNNTSAPTYETTEARGDFVIANAMLGHPFNLVKNAGVPGESAEQIELRVSTDVLPFSPKLVDLYAGQNQGTDAGGAVTPADTTLSTIIRICERIRLSGATVVYNTVMTRPGGSDTAVELARKAYINRGMKAYATSTSNILISDAATALTDPTTGLFYADSTQDTLHKNARGALRAAKVKAAALQPLVRLQTSNLTYAQNYLNYAGNPMHQGDNASGTNGFTAATGVTGTGANGMAIAVRNTGTVAASKIARTVGPDGLADPKSRIVLSTAADYDAAYFFFGGADLLNLGRYDVNSPRSTAVVAGYTRAKPSTANGFTYICFTSGTTGTTEPVWPTTEGNTVVDGTATWMCQKMPAQGDVFVAECEVELSALTAGKAVEASLTLYAYTATPTLSKYTIDLNFQTSGALGIGWESAPPFLRLRTPPLVMPALDNALRYLDARVAIYGQAGGSVTADISRTAIMRIST